MHDCQKVGEFAVLCPLSCITSNTFFSRKVNNKQDKQLKPCHIYTAVGIMYIGLIKEIIFAFQDIEKYVLNEQLCPASPLTHYQTKCP